MFKKQHQDCMKVQLVDEKMCTRRDMTEACVQWLELFNIAS